MTEFRRKRLLDDARDLRQKIDSCKLEIARAETSRELEQVVVKHFDDIRAKVILLEADLERAAATAAA